MLNVGSPHSWPILLGALIWLIEVSMQLFGLGDSEYNHSCYENLLLILLAELWGT
jgi:SMC interacting uncharacterized protein involved in chromosome segregation